ncbi:Clavaminate synthase-like protein [Xylona heveae TC161]|uniref:Clavaminate synthase-like protein n=1 Tax=Xylona heveae (strain CBS 132557 / TC161) TaxID=1328760 RepID=A0A164ZJW2_XYLHT|nr:Clavaminate synthase-like protein [Xylona heveae TC161]KZF19187.1 Clavaminate synthase-like protein [Xylona heveae TC161]
MATAQPDIQYKPDFEKFKQCGRLRQANENLPTTLPGGFPAKLSSPLVWHGKDIEKQTDWIYQLSDAQLDEIDAALKSFKGLNLPLGHINQTTFPLPHLHAELRNLSKELHVGRGFFVIRGLRVDSYTREENVIIYAGVSAHVADVRGRQQDPHFTGGKSLVVSHIKDLSRTKDAAKVGAPSNTADKQVFHTDGGDVISLLCLNPSPEGGESYISSSWHIYNILAKERPDLIHTLSENWPFDGFGNAQRPYSLRPLLFHQPATGSAPERIMIQYARRYFTGFQAQPRSSDILPITASRGAGFPKGDVQCINNHSIFHAGNGFTDEPGNERHLIRLWLRDSEYAWDTPALLHERWEHVYKDVKEDEQVFPLEPNVHKSLGS